MACIGQSLPITTSPRENGGAEDNGMTQSSGGTEGEQAGPHGFDAAPRSGGSGGSSDAHEPYVRLAGSCASLDRLRPRPAAQAGRVESVREPLPISVSSFLCVIPFSPSAQLVCRTDSAETLH